MTTPSAGTSSEFPDVTTLTYQQATEYRQEILNAILEPGTEYDMAGEEGAADDHAYRVQLGKLDAHIATFGHNDPAKGDYARYNS